MATLTTRERRRSAVVSAPLRPPGSLPLPYRARDAAVALGLGLIAFLVYARTLYPAIAWGDSPELTAAAYQAGVPHPTGYPLYMLLGHLWVRLCPVGSVAYRMNLLSALSAAGAVALLYPLLRRISGSRLVSIPTALLFAFTPTFWSQALLAEVYDFHMLGVTAVLGAVLLWDQRADRRWLWAAAVLYGLCFTHHLTSALLAPALLFFALTSPQRRQFLRELPRTLPLFLLPFLLYLYLPLAAGRDPAMNWGDPRTWENFLAHVTGKQYQSGMFQLTAAQRRLLLDKAFGLGTGSEGGFFWNEFGLAFLGLVPLGWWRLARSHGRLLGLTLLVFLATVGYALNYDIYDIEVYYLPAHLMVAVWIAGGLAQLAALFHQWREKRRGGAAPWRWLSPVLGVGLLGMPLSLLGRHWKQNDHHDDRSALIYARAALDALPPDTVLISGDDNFQFPLLYTLFVEQRRPDVTLVGLHHLARPNSFRLIRRLRREGLVVNARPPAKDARWGDRDYSQRLSQLVADNIDRRPVYAVLPPDLLQRSWIATALAPYYRVGRSNLPTVQIRRQAPSLAVPDPRPAPRQTVSFGPLRPDGSVGEGLELLGYDLTPRRQRGLPWLRVSYTWRVRDVKLARQATVWVMFTDANGQCFKMPDGSLEFHNAHPLAYGLGQQGVALPRTLKETFDLYVPPRQWQQRLRMRLAVAVGGQLLKTGPDGSEWIELQELPAELGQLPESPAAPLQ